MLLLDDIGDTHTYAILELSGAAFDEIAAQLRAAGYDHAFHAVRDYGIIVDMHGIAVAKGIVDDAAVK
jgi:hypothetical protein